MYSLSDAVVGFSLVAVIAGYLLVNQVQGMPKEAVLAEISVILNDLESELKKSETVAGYIPQNKSLFEIFKNGKNTALSGKPGDVVLMPDIIKKDNHYRIGGCPVKENQWVLLRTDYAIMTQVPEDWKGAAKVCLDRNGPGEPNLEGYDIIWLSFSRIGSPHTTLIPVQLNKQDSDPYKTN